MANACQQAHVAVGSSGFLITSEAIPIISALPSFPWCLPYVGGVMRTRISGSRRGQGEAAERDVRD
jgi:hypothetical protein